MKKRTTKRVSNRAKTKKSPAELKPRKAQGQSELARVVAQLAHSAGKLAQAADRLAQATERRHSPEKQPDEGQRQEKLLDKQSMELGPHPIGAVESTDVDEGSEEE
jgi:hypothetical protein